MPSLAAYASNDGSEGFAWPETVQRLQKPGSFLNVSYGSLRTSDRCLVEPSTGGRPIGWFADHAVILCGRNIERCAHQTIDEAGTDRTFAAVYIDGKSADEALLRRSLPVDPFDVNDNR